MVMDVGEQSRVTVLILVLLHYRYEVANEAALQGLPWRRLDLTPTQVGGSDFRNIALILYTPNSFTLNFLATLLLHFLSHSTTLFMSPSHTHFQSTSTHYPTTRLSLLYKLATPPTTTHLYLPTCTRAYLLRVLL